MTKYIVTEIMLSVAEFKTYYNSMEEALDYANYALSIGSDVVIEHNRKVTEEDPIKIPKFETKEET